MGDDHLCPKCAKPHLSAHALNLHMKIGHKNSWPESEGGPGEVPDQGKALQGKAFLLSGENTLLLTESLVQLEAENHPLAADGIVISAQTGEGILMTDQSLSDTNQMSHGSYVLPPSTKDLLPPDSLTDGNQVRETSKLCSICGKWVKDLRDHFLNVHTAGDVPFQCESCDFRTSNRKNFLAHKRAKHGNSRQCSVCHYKTHSKFNLRQDFFLHGTQGVFGGANCNNACNL